MERRAAAVHIGCAVSGPLPPQKRSWDDLLSTGPERGADEIADAVKRGMGMDVPPPPPEYRADPEAWAGLAEGLGLR